VLTAALLPAAASGGTRLVLIGGGDPPKQAIARFAEWAGGTQARILVVNWASGEPKESCDDVLKEVAAYAPAAAECGPGTVLDAKGRAAPLEPEGARDFRERLARASGVFFTGGDQARVMDVLEDDGLLSALRARFAAGVVFGGTSAGTAIMSKIMITGEGDFTVIDGAKVEVRPGLGLIDGAIVDQHFVKRQRENRLFGLVLAHPGLRGIGVDEATALLVRDGRQAEVVGAGVVLLVDAKGKDRLAVTIVRPGQGFDLKP
jgi:cyanophycinase